VSSVERKHDDIVSVSSVERKHDDMVSVSSVECKHSEDRSVTDLSEVRQVESSPDDSEMACQVLAACCEELDKTESPVSVLVHRDTDSGDLQLTDSDVCEDLMSLSSGDVHRSVYVCKSNADNQQLSDAAEPPAVIEQLNTLTDAHSSHPDQSKLDHSVISSALKNISQSEDRGLIYIVYSKPSSDHVIIVVNCEWHMKSSCKLLSLHFNSLVFTTCSCKL